MSTSYLERMFRPRSVAVVGANDKPQRVGGVIMRNLLSGGFVGPIMPVNPRHDSVAGVLTYPDIASLPRTPDVAVLCTPPETVPGLVDELGARGTRAAVVVARGLATTRDAAGRSLQDRMLAAAKAHGMRILGGGTLGLLVPHIGLDASFSRVRALPGELGFVSQSDAMGTLVLDWAHPRRIGFSHFISLGDAADIGFAEALDYLGSDPDTRAILLYIESLGERRRFMAAARGAARNKPVLAIKAGRRPPAGPGVRGPLSADTLSLVEPDAVLDAALRRAGILRVERLEELFSAVGTLARARPRHGERLAVVSNGGGAGVMAADELYAGGLRLAELTEATAARLRAAVPGWDGRGPIDIQVDAPGSRYAEVVRILVESRELDTVLAIHTPSALASSTEAARAVIQAAAGHPCNLLTCWMGGETLAAARKLLVEAGVATFDTPADAVRAFRFTVTWQRNRDALIQTPPSVPAEFQPDTAAARAVIRAALEEGRDFLRAPERMAVLAAYGLPVAEAHTADTPEQAATLARRIGFPVDLAARSPDVRRKRELGAVAVSLETPEAVEAAARNLLSHLSTWRPDARLTGFTVQRNVPRPRARQLFVGVAVDPFFGPVILFGEARTGEASRDFGVGLPPLNLPLARELISRSRVAELLEQGPTRPAADREALALALVKVSQLVVDLPEIVEMDVDPLLADERGVIAIDAYLRVAPATGAEDRLAIRPYPQWLEEKVRLRDGQEAVLRPVRPEDEPSHDDFISRLTPEDIRFRFFHFIPGLTHTEMARLTQIDYDREMAFIATAPGPGAREETLGVVRAVADPDNECAEFSVVVRSDQKRRGIASLLMRKMLAYARGRGTRVLEGEVLGDNGPMLALARHLGATVHGPEADAVFRVTFDLQQR